MLILRHMPDRSCLLAASKLSRLTPLFMSTLEEQEARGEFRVLQLLPKKLERKKIVRQMKSVLPPREMLMDTKQDWPSVWPGPRTFHPHVVPLPVRQGYCEEGKAPLDKYANVELMKIPNFLHLTPPAIRRQCEAIKKFCTKWPRELMTEQDCFDHFPMEIITSDYLYSSPTIREPLSRIVSIRVKLSQLALDTHAKDKIHRLLGPRYDSTTDYVTIVVDRCPTRKQNTEYAKYLLTAVYNESKKIESWEAKKTTVDMEYYNWDMNKSKKNLISMFAWPEPPTDDDYTQIPNASEYKEAVCDMINEGEDEFSVNKYKESVLKLLKLHN